MAEPNEPEHVDGDTLVKAAGELSFNCRKSTLIKVKPIFTGRLAAIFWYTSLLEASEKHDNIRRHLEEKLGRLVRRTHTIGKAVCEVTIAHDSRDKEDKILKKLFNDEHNALVLKPHQGQNPLPVDFKVRFLVQGSEPLPPRSHLYIPILSHHYPCETVVVNPTVSVCNALQKIESISRIDFNFQGQGQEKRLTDLIDWDILFIFVEIGRLLDLTKHLQKDESHRYLARFPWSREDFERDVSKVFTKTQFLECRRWIRGMIQGFNDRIVRGGSTPRQHDCLDVLKFIASYFEGNYVKRNTQESVESYPFEPREIAYNLPHTRYQPQSRRRSVSYHRI